MPFEAHPTATLSKTSARYPCAQSAWLQGPLLRLARVLCSGRAEGFLWGVSLSQRLVSLNRITDSPSEANPAADMLTGATTQGLKCDLWGRFHGKFCLHGEIRSSGHTKPAFHPSTEKSLVPSLLFSWSYGRFGPGDPLLCLMLPSANS